MVPNKCKKNDINLYNKANVWQQSALSQITYQSLGGSRQHHCRAGLVIQWCIGYSDDVTSSANDHTPTSQPPPPKITLIEGNPQNWGALGPADPWKYAPPHVSCRIWSFSVRQYYANEDPSLKYDPSRPASFQGTQGHRNRYGSIGHVWLPINVP